MNLISKDLCTAAFNVLSINSIGYQTICVTRYVPDIYIINFGKLLKYGKWNQREGYAVFHLIYKNRLFGVDVINNDLKNKSIAHLVS